MNLIQLMEYISPEYICKVVTPKKLDYSDIRLICGAETVFIDNCIYLGSLSNVPAEAYKDKLIGLITTHDADYTDMELDYIKLSDDANILALYEELRELWNNNNIGKIVTILSTIFNSTDIIHIVNQTSWIMNNPVVLLDYNSQLLAYCCEQPIDDPDIKYLLKHERLSPKYVKETRGKDISKMLLNSSAPIIVEADGLDMTHKRLTGIIWVNQKSQAMISVLEYNRKLTVADSNILGYICGILSQLIERRIHHDRQTSIMSIMYENRLFALMNQDDNDLSWIPGWLSYMRWEKHQIFYTVVVKDTGDLRNSAQIMEIRDKLRQRTTNRYVFLHENDIVIILNAKDTASFQQFVEALEDVLSEYKLSAGISKRFTEIRELGEHCRQAEDAIKIAKLLGQQCIVSMFDRQIPYELLLAAQTRGSLKRYGDYRLHLLNEYDRRLGTDYYLTLYTYLQSTCNRTQAARRLHISRNTMDYRMNKIREMLEFIDYDGDEYMKLYLAFKAQELEKANPFPDSFEKKD